MTSRIGQIRDLQLGRPPAAGGSELGQHGIKIPALKVDHKWQRAQTEVECLRWGFGRNRLLASRDRGESLIGLLRFDGQSQVFAIATGEGLGVARFEKYTADSKQLSQTISFSLRGQTFKP